MTGMSLYRRALDARRIDTAAGIDRDAEGAGGTGGLRGPARYWVRELMKQV